MNPETRPFWDAQLENSVVVPGAAEWIDRYPLLSAQVGRMAEAERFPTGPDPMQGVWRTPTGRSRRALVFVHGGYWRRFSASDFAFVAESAAAADATLWNVDYRLLPGVRMADAVADTIAACALALSHADRAVIVGHSAGAHLALEAAMKLERVPDAVVAISGLYELEPLRNCFIQEDISLTAKEVVTFSPQDDLSVVPCPVHVRVGGDEKYEFQRQSVRLFDGLKAAGKDATFAFQEGKNHFEIVADLGDGTTPLSQEIAAVMRG